MPKGRKRAIKAATADEVEVGLSSFTLAMTVRSVDPVRRPFCSTNRGPQYTHLIRQPCLPLCLTLAPP